MDTNRVINRENKKDIYSGTERLMERERERERKKGREREKERDKERERHVVIETSRDR